MVVSEFFSKSINKKININNIIDKMMNPNTANNIRKFSVAQKIRKRSLFKLLNPDNKKDDEFIKNFNKSLGLKIENIIEYINFDFSSHFNNLNKVNKKIVDNKSLQKTKFAKELLSLFENNKFEKFSLIIHGSQADGEITKYSDIDVSIFLKNETITNKQDLKEIFFYIDIFNKKINFFDPLSHHSVFLNVQSDLNCYAESFMPIKVLEKGCFPKNQTIEFIYTRDDLDLKIENFFNILKIIINLDNNNKINSLYGLKQLLSSYFMLLILEYEIINNKYLDKKQIFQSEIKKYKSKKEMEVFSTASLIRTNWPNIEKSNVNVSNEFIKDLLNHSFIMSQNIQDPQILKKINEIYLG